MKDSFLKINIMRYSQCARQQWFLRVPQIFVCASAVFLPMGSMATTYVYVGKPYDPVTYGLDAVNTNVGPAPAPYSGAMFLSGRFETSARLPGNLTEQTDIGADGLNLINSWSFNDGVRDYTPQNSALVPQVPALSGVGGQFSGASVKTDGLGNITGYAFWANAPLPPNSVGQKVDYFLTSANTGLGGREGDEIGNQMTCAIAPIEFGNQCASSGYPFTAWFFNETPGKWSSFDPLPDSGQGTAGTAAVAIANVAANDGVNGAPATLGAGGSGLLAPSGNWPAGISLDTATGAVSLSAALAAGSYALTYQLCDSQSPLACVEVAVTVKVLAAQPPRPAQATPVPALGHGALAALFALFSGLAAFALRRGRAG